MAIRFIPVSEINDPLNITIGLSGGSGTGKTYSALLIARGIAEIVTGRKGAPIGYVDTEGKRALHYKAGFPEMCHFDFEAVNENGELIGFPPERWIEVIDAAEVAEMPVLVIDSFSHSWEGVGGVLDLQAQVLDRLVREAEARNQRYNNSTAVDPAKYGQLSWAEVKPRYRRLIDRIVRAKTNIIICTRAKPVMQQGFGDKAKNARKTKTRREDVPWDPASDADLMFEMTAMVILDPSAPGCPFYQIKVADQFKSLFDKRKPMGQDTGRAMAEWAKGQGGAQAHKDTMDFAREKARAGTEVFMAWWNSAEGKQVRAVVRPIMPEIQAICAEADAEAGQSDDNPFGNPADAIPAAAKTEGPDDTQRGEAGVDYALKSDVEVIKARIAGSRTPKDLGNVETEYLAIAVSLPQSVADEIEGMLAEKRQYLKAA